MSLFHQFVFVILLIEMAVFLLLIAPLPLSWRKGAVLAISKSPYIQAIRTPIYMAMAFVCLLLVDSVNKSYGSVGNHHSSDGGHYHGVHHTDPNMETYEKAKLFYAQRNVYLTGSVLFLFIVLRRFCGMVVELIKSEEKADVLKQQAAKTSKEYMKLLDKDQEYEKEKEALEKKLADAVEKAASVDILKKQADQTTKEYLRLTDQVVELEKKLALAGGDISSSSSKKDI